MQKTPDQPIAELHLIHEGFIIQIESWKMTGSGRESSWPKIPEGEERTFLTISIGPLSKDDRIDGFRCFDGISDRIYFDTVTKRFVE